MFTKPILTASAIALAVALTPGAFAAGKNHDTELQARGITRQLIQTNASANTFTGPTSQQVTGAASISLPTNATGFFVATFSAESNCSGGPGNWCTVSISCDGVELQPSTGTGFAFDSVGPVSSTSNWKSLSMTRRSNVVTGGTHTCEVRTAQTSAATSLRLDEWTFTVQFWKQ
jgi:hypothetical protein